VSEEAAVDTFCCHVGVSSAADWDLGCSVPSVISSKYRKRSSRSGIAPNAQPPDSRVQRLQGGGAVNSHWLAWRHPVTIIETFEEDH
jgi:hypothetical protein